jgi:hypothetical protein
MIVVELSVTKYRATAALTELLFVLNVRATKKNWYKITVLTLIIVLYTIKNQQIHSTTLK